VDEQLQRGRARRGQALSPRRIEFRALLDQGMTSQDASFRIGINPRTGRDWAKGIVRSRKGRFTMTGELVWAAPGKPAEPLSSKAISPRLLSVDERIEIADLRRAGTAVREIARRLGRAPSTVSRELRRNAHVPSGAYRPWAAQER
jgi:transposase